MNEGFFILTKTLFLINEKRAIQTSKNGGFALTVAILSEINFLKNPSFIYWIQSYINTRLREMVLTAQCLIKAASARMAVIRSFFNIFL